MHKLLLLITLLCALATAKPTIAIRDIKAVGTPKNEAALVTSKLQNSFVNTKRFEVLERAEIDEIVKEMEFQSSGLCDDANCLVELGKMLSVEKVIVGSVGKIDGSYTLSIRMLDVETGIVEHSYASKRAGSIGVLYDSLIPTAVTEFIKNFDFSKHKLRADGRAGLITPKLALLERQVILANRDSYITIHPLLTRVKNAAKPKRLTYKLGNHEEKAIPFEYNSEEEKVLHVKHHKERKRVEVVESFPKRPKSSWQNSFSLKIPKSDTLIPLIVTLTCESGALVSDTTHIATTDVTSNTVSIQGLSLLQKINKISKLSTTLDADPLKKEYLNLQIQITPVSLFDFHKQMKSTKGYKSNWKTVKPLDISEFPDKLNRKKRTTQYNDSLMALENRGLSWFNAVLYCNALSKIEGLDTLYRYDKIKGAPGSYKCKLINVELRSGNGYRLIKKVEAQKLLRCGTELYDNNAGLLMNGYEWCNEKGLVFSAMGDKKKFPPHTYKIQKKTNSRGGIVPGFRVVKALQ